MRSGEPPAQELELHLYKEVEVGSTREHLEEEDRKEGGDVILGGLDAVVGEGEEGHLCPCTEVYGARSRVIVSSNDMLQQHLLSGMPLIAFMLQLTGSRAQCMNHCAVSNSVILHRRCPVQSRCEGPRHAVGPLLCCCCNRAGTAQPELTDWVSRFLRVVCEAWLAARLRGLTFCRFPACLTTFAALLTPFFACLSRCLGDTRFPLLLLLSKSGISRGGPCLPFDIIYAAVWCRIVIRASQLPAPCPTVLVQSLDRLVSSCRSDTAGSAKVGAQSSCEAANVISTRVATWLSESTNTRQHAMTIFGGPGTGSAEVGKEVALLQLAEVSNFGVALLLLLLQRCSRCGTLRGRAVSLDAQRGSYPGPLWGHDTPRRAKLGLVIQSQPQVGKLGSAWARQTCTGPQNPLHRCAVRVCVAMALCVAQLWLPVKVWLLYFGPFAGHSLTAL